MSVGTTSSCAPAAAAVPARPRTQRRRRTPRAPVRWRVIKLRFSLEAPDPSRPPGGTTRRISAADAVIQGLMRLRLTLAGVLAAGLATAAPAGATLNPQHAGLQVALRAQ